MATLSLVLDKRRQKKDGTYPLIINTKYFDIMIII
jgi:hypothetical protein